jgi:two-component system chemotaxis sensor kinase CheA
VTDLRARLLDAFQVEHKEQLSAVRALLDRLDADSATPADREELFRQVHSFRAAARACDFPTVEALGKRLETLFSQVRKGTLRPSMDVLDAVRAALNAIEKWAAKLAEGAQPPEPADALTALERALAGGAAPVAPAEDSDLDARVLAAFQVEHKEHLEGIRALLAQVESGTQPPTGAVDEAFRRAHSLKGAARLAGLHGAEVLAHRLETLFAQVREGKLSLGGPVVRALHQGLDAIEDEAAGIAQKRAPADPGPVLDAMDRILGKTGPAVPATPPPPDSPAEAPPAPSPAAPSSESVRVSAANLDQLLQSTEELLTEGQQYALATRDLVQLERKLAGLEKEWDALRGTEAVSLRELAKTPGLERVVRYLGRLEQVLRALTRQARGAAQRQRQSADSLNLLGRQLRQDVRRVRTVSAESIFQGFRKLVRDQARDEGKEVEIRISGLEVEADRAVLQVLKDPLMHVLSNAVTHGIELAEERRRQNKPPAGLVGLHLEVVGNRLRVLVEDDGRGISFRAVGQAAVRQGLLSEEQAAEMIPEELVRLVFRAGFSTARAVSGLAGRGMGLSVVQEAVSRLQGEVTLAPRQGGGTVLTLAVPLTVATHRLLLVACRGQTYAVPVHAIERILRVKLSEVETALGRPMLLLDGQPVPLVGLAVLLELGESAVHAVDDRLTVMLLRQGPRRLAVAVDAFLAEQEGLIKALDAPANRVRKLAGGILLENGTAALVLNPAELLALAPTEKLPALQTAAPAATPRVPTVLVVDDSLTTRTLEKSILEAHGYQVQLAVDGVEALERLRTGPADLVITDIQMPRMDGFQLLEEIKKDQQFARLPVIVVTSQERREDQERGLALGADAYVVKRKFDHESLLATIRQIL